MTVKAITFDFWQTLYKSNPIDYNEKTRQLQANIEQAGGVAFTFKQIKDAVKAARSVWSHTWAEEHRTLSAKEWLTTMFTELDISVDPTALQKIQADMETSVLKTPPTLIEELPTVLAKLSKRYQLGVISDTGLTPGWVLRQILEQDNIINHFTHLTFSDELGRSKPNPQPFLATLKALNSEPKEAVHVGDLLRTDIAGAQNVGMRAVQYIGVSRDGWSMSMAHPPKTAVIPTAVINNHTELMPLLQQWNGAG